MLCFSQGEKQYHLLDDIEIKSKKKIYTTNKLKKSLRTVNYPVAGNHNFRKKYFPLFVSDTYKKTFENTIAGNFIEEAVYISNNKQRDMYIERIKFYLRDNFHYEGSTKCCNKIIFILRVYSTKKCSLEYSKSERQPDHILFQIKDTLTSSILLNNDSLDKNLNRNLLSQNLNTPPQLIVYYLGNQKIKFPKEGIFISIEPISCNKYGECSIVDSVRFHKREYLTNSVQSFSTSFSQSAGFSAKGLLHTPPVFIKDKKNNTWWDITFEKLAHEISNKESKKLRKIKNIDKREAFVQSLQENYYHFMYHNIKNITSQGQFLYPLFQIESF